MSVDINSVTQSQSVKPTHAFTAAVHRASTTALVMSVAAVALVGVDGIVAIHRDAKPSHSTAAASTLPGSPASPNPGGTEVTPTSPGTAPATPTTSASPATSGTQHTLQALLTTTYAKALLQHSVHSLAHDVTNGDGTATFDDLDATASGEQHITVHGGHVQIRVIGQTTYFTGDARGMAKYFQFTKQEIKTVGRQWVPLVAGQTGYTEVTAGVTLASTLAEDEISSPLRREPEKTIDSQLVFGISGLGTGAGSPKNAHSTMWISVSTGLPVEYDATNGKTQLTQTFSDWGKPVHIPTPTNIFGQPGLSS